MRLDKTMYEYKCCYREGYDDGYDDGYHEACEIWQRECQQVRDALRALLDATINGGEAPAHEVTG